MLGQRCALLPAAALLIALLAGDARAAEPLTVHVDEATLMRLPEKVGTLVIGNPLIADVTLQSGGLVVVTGKGYGTTNLIALDRDGNVLLEKPVFVTGAKDKTLVVYRGNDRQTYSCSPRCERRITLGDSPESFGPTLNQTVLRNSQASGTAQADGGR